MLRWQLTREECSLVDIKGTPAIDGDKKYTNCLSTTTKLAQLNDNQNTDRVDPVHQQPQSGRRI